MHISPEENETSSLSVSLLAPARSAAKPRRCEMYDEPQAPRIDGWSRIFLVSLCLLLLGALSAEDANPVGSKTPFGNFGSLLDAESIPPDLPSGLVAATRWSCTDSGYFCTVYEKAATEEEARPLRVLTFCEADSADKQWKYETADAFVSMFPLADESDALMTIWTGGSAYHCVIFTTTAGEPHVSLEFGTLSPPEIVTPLMASPASSGDTIQRETVSRT